MVFGHLKTSCIIATKGKANSSFHDLDLFFHYPRRGRHTHTLPHYTQPADRLFVFNLLVTAMSGGRSLTGHLCNASPGCEPLCHHCFSVKIVKKKLCLLLTILPCDIQCRFVKKVVTVKYPVASSKEKR